MSTAATKRTNGNTKVPAHLAKLFDRQADSVIKIDLGSGGPHEGFITFDIRPLPGVDIVHDWEEIPWPLPSSCATLLMAGHVVEHVNPARFGFINWMDEAWRVLKYDGQLMISTPFAGSTGYFSDPTHINPCTNRTWEWFDPLAPSKLYYQYKPKPWRIQNCFWSVDGNMECLMVKRREDVSYK